MDFDVKLGYVNFSQNISIFWHSGSSDLRFWRRKLCLLLKATSMPVTNVKLDTTFYDAWTLQSYLYQQITPVIVKIAVY